MGALKPRLRNTINFYGRNIVLANLRRRAESRETFLGGNSYYVYLMNNSGYINNKDGYIMTNDDYIVKNDG